MTAQITIRSCKKRIVSPNVKTFDVIIDYRIVQTVTEFTFKDVISVDIGVGSRVFHKSVTSDLNPFDRNECAVLL